ncbi:S-phase kinase-associated protein 2 [Frankliniella fusca]|uniref:S-phase kinase-associated protein 2 n=1 Tax=Frankliniella fusca TaxID=407009 RepID=A0AAE1LWR9_9NEOP|nr:S-phase kinase-associated protein 2 [Frankliniella fusca]
MELVNPGSPPNVQKKKSPNRKPTGERSNQKPNEAPCFIDQLPNEILVSIFTYLKPKELLYGAGLVSKRWYELACDTKVWQKSTYCLWDDIRIWRHAPVIGHLEVLAPNEVEVEKVRQLALSPNPASIRSMRIILRHPKDSIAILQRYDKTLRTLDLQVAGQDAQPHEWKEFFDTIGSLAELRSLSVRISPNSSDIPYDKQISAGCRSLRSLRVRGQETIAAAIVRDLGSVVASLTITCSFAESSVQLIRSLSACSAVEDVTIPCSMIAAVGHFSSLKCLKIIADHGPLNLSEAINAAKPVILKIERLEVCASRHQLTPNVAINQCVAGFAPFLKKCKLVDLRGLHSLDEYLSEFIQEAEKVQRYYLCCRVYHLMQLEFMPAVTFVHAILDEQTMFVPYVMDAVNRLKQHPKKTFKVFFHCLNS